MRWRKRAVRRFKLTTSTQRDRWLRSIRTSRNVRHPPLSSPSLYLYDKHVSLQPSSQVQLDKLLFIDDRGQTDRVTIIANLNPNPISWSWLVAFDFYSHTRAKYQGQSSVGSRVRMETNGRTDTTDRITFFANMVGNNGYGLNEATPTHERNNTSSLYEKTWSGIYSYLQLILKHPKTNWKQSKSVLSVLSLWDCGQFLKQGSAVRMSSTSMSSSQHFRSIASMRMPVSSVSFI